MRIARRMNDELIAGRDARADHDGQAIGEDRIGDGARAREADGRARVLATQRVARAGARAARSRSRCSAPRLVRVTVTGRACRCWLVAAVTPYAAPTLKKLPPSAPVRSMPSRCCAFTWVAMASADAAEFIARRIEHLAAPVEQAAERAAGHAARNVDGARAGVCSASSVRSGSSGSDRRGDLRCRGAEHQRLAVADEYVERGIAFGDDRDADLARELVDERSRWSSRSFGGWPVCWTATAMSPLSLRDTLRERRRFRCASTPSRAHRRSVDMSRRRVS